MFRKILALGCAVALSAAPASAQLLNGGFEAPDASGGDQPGTADWLDFNPGFTFTTAAQFRSGSQSLKTFGPFNPGGGAGVLQSLPANPGDTWIGTIWALDTPADPIDAVDFGVYKIEFRDANGDLAAGGQFGVDIFESNFIDASAPDGEWIELGVGTAPAPEGTTTVQVVIVKVDLDGGGGGSIFWDDASLELDDPVPVVETTVGELKGIFSE